MDYKIYRISEIEINNFKSYKGTRKFSFDTRARIIKLSGKVGAGKTNLLSAIIFALYGSTTGKVNAKSGLLNEEVRQNLGKKIKNTQELFSVKLKYLTQDKQEFILKRTVYKSTTKIELFDSTGSNIISTVKTVDDAQQWLVDNVLSAIPYNLYAYAFTFFTESSLTALKFIYEKTAIFDILDYFVDSNAYLEFTEQISSLKNSLKQDVDNLLSNYNLLLQQVTVANEKLRNMTTDASNKINEEVTKLTTQINEYQAKISSAQTVINDINGTLQQLTIEANKYYGNIRALEAEISQLTNEQRNLSAVNGQATCPTCKQPINHELLSTNINQVNTAITNKRAAVSELQAMYNELNTKITDLNRQLSNKSSEISTLQQKIADINLQINTLQTKFSVESKSLQEQINSLVAQGNNTSTALITAYKKYVLLNHAYNKVIANNRLKQSLYLNVVHNMNNTIKQYASMYMFDLFPRFITVYERKHWAIDLTIHNNATGLERDKLNLSTGERRIASLLLLIALLGQVKAKYGLVNILLLDEFISNFDKTTKDNVVNILESITREYDLQIFLITHSDVSFTVDNQVIAL